MAVCDICNKNIAWEWERRLTIPASPVIHIRKSGTFSMVTTQLCFAVVFPAHKERVSGGFEGGKATLKPPISPFSRRVVLLRLFA